MKIDNTSNIYQYRNTDKKAKLPAFTALHTVRYYMKAQDGKYYQVTDVDVIKQLQRKIVTWLNQHYNNFSRIVNGESVKPKKESNNDKLLRERLVNFFINNDGDYREKRIAKSAYINSNTGLNSTYILTGKSTKKIEDAAKTIERVHSDINERLDLNAESTNFTRQKSASDNLKIKQAKHNYHIQVEKAVKTLAADPQTDKTSISFYFEPLIPATKKKKATFKLVNALIQRFMIQN